MVEVLLFGGSSETIRLCVDLGYSIIAVVDPGEAKTFHGYRLIKSDSLAIQEYPGVPAVVSIDDCNNRARVFSFLKKKQVECLSLLGGTYHSLVGDGAFMQLNSFISSDVKVGKGVRLNYGATAMHDCNLGDFVTLAPQCMLLGGVTVGDMSYVGSCATVLPSVQIGRNCMIGAGAVVTRDVLDNSTVKGVPAV